METQDAFEKLRELDRAHRAAHAEAEAAWQRYYALVDEMEDAGEWDTAALDKAEAAAVIADEARALAWSNLDAFKARLLRHMP